MSRHLCKAGQHRLHGLLPIQREHGSVSLLFQGHAQNAKGVRFLGSAILVPCFLNTKVLGCFVFRDLEQQKDFLTTFQVLKDWLHVYPQDRRSPQPRLTSLAPAHTWPLPNPSY